MKGLFLKDWYLMKKYCRFLFLFVICFLVAGFIKKDGFFHAYSMLMISIVPVTLLSYDEKSKWNIYSQTMPYTKKQIVSEKYLVMFALLGIVSVLICIGQYFITKTELSSDIWYYYTLRLQTVVMIFSICIIMSSILLSVLFKFGIAYQRAYDVNHICHRHFTDWNIMVDSGSQLRKKKILKIFCLSVLFHYSQYN